MAACFLWVSLGWFVSGVYGLGKVGIYRVSIKAENIDATEAGAGKSGAGKSGAGQSGAGVRSLSDLMSELRVEVEGALELALAKRSGVPERLAEAMRYSLLAPGKRLRPLLALFGAQAVGGDMRQAMHAAVAVEMIHTYSLIHDDLPAMDDDDLRRGRPTCHVQFDEATAILAGDGLLALAFEVLAEGLMQRASENPYFTPAVLGDALRRLAQAAGPEALVGGQAMDLLAEKEGGDLEKLQQIHRGKTGAMIRVSLELGGISGGGTSFQLDSLQQYGNSLGLAFQVVDDLLDVESNAAAMGKRTGKDQSRGKLTYPGLLGVEPSWEKARGLVRQAEKALEGLGNAAWPLVELARYVLSRKN
jgi:geranylgeranyl diphosphate synthase type II